MPTTLPDAVARDRDQRRRTLAELVPLAIVIVYLLLLICSAVSLATDVSALFASDQRPDGYNPMEPLGRTAEAMPIRSLAPR